MGIDAGGQGSTSGGYDHLGYSVLMNTRDSIADRAKAPVELQAKMVVEGKTVMHNELGMLNNTFATTALKNRGVAVGTVITLSPVLPEGTEDTGNWLWDTGDTTRELTITANTSHIYRVRYTNVYGVESEQSYSIAVLGDGQPTPLSATITTDGQSLSKQDVEVEYGQTVTLTLKTSAGYGNFEWENGVKTESVTLQNVVRDRRLTACFVNQAGRRNYMTFNIKVVTTDPVGIKTEETSNHTPVSNHIYDLSGRRVSHAIAGHIYIVNGKKVKF